MHTPRSLQRPEDHWRCCFHRSFTAACAAPLCRRACVQSTQSPRRAITQTTAAAASTIDSLMCLETHSCCGSACPSDIICSSPRVAPKRQNSSRGEQWCRRQGESVSASVLRGPQRGGIRRRALDFPLFAAPLHARLPGLVPFVLHCGCWSHCSLLSLVFLSSPPPPASCLSPCCLRRCSSIRSQPVTRNTVAPTDAQADRQQQTQVGLQCSAGRST